MQHHFYKALNQANNINIDIGLDIDTDINIDLDMVKTFLAMTL